jgi:chorismate dehydratase
LRSVVADHELKKDLQLSLRAKLKYLTKMRVGAVSYLNAKPLQYGLKHHPIKNEIELIEDYPSRIAQMLIDGDLDIGLIPVAATTKMKEWHIVGNYCIGADGPVASVCIFSEVPMDQVQRVYLDYQSRTSVNLARILLKEFWKKDVEFVNASGEDFREKITRTTAGVVIGDRALEQRLRSKYIYDLAEAWKQHTGLPFVFAAWISNKQLPAEFVKAFDEANALGLENIGEVIAESNCKTYDLQKYFKQDISYDLDQPKLNAMNIFLQKLKAAENMMI